ncbi:uncharacterized protein LOC128254075 [Drosophila gunungcola]|uniref:MADF domain-containing protein n=1 Tax=Drosophila gunungcola TaxID=103775 RepID=A0A9Q0BPM9_9MUSC|nr:uncharacterized protein LOC128254075 [Drosophila gunungcola]KAI8039591.1 hypothetical protein M5D96_007011 [Drosophila gunungcola]
MPNKTEEVGDFQVTKRQGRQRRKQTIWTREKIAKLIELYRTSDCLWNHYSDLYKNKDCRTKAIDSICTGLGITKNDYGKKIHNLRNQYNSELKKLERRLEVSGSSSAEKTCRWEHFKSLMFLRSVIEPRPGYQQGPQCKKLITKLDFSYAEQEVSKQSQSSIENLESLIMENEAEVVELPKFSEPIPMPTEPAPSFKFSAPSRLAEAPTISAPVHIPPSGRDQWDAFGELIASEFRNLNSEISRKRLKRKIMQVMLEVGEEDDLEYPSTNS